LHTFLLIHQDTLPIHVVNGSFVRDIIEVKEVIHDLLDTRCFVPLPFFRELSTILFIVMDINQVKQSLTQRSALRCFVARKVTSVTDELHIPRTRSEPLAFTLTSATTASAIRRISTSSLHTIII
jgi:hypothetical protein